MSGVSPEIITAIMMAGVLVGVLLGYHLAIVVGAIGIIVGVFLFGTPVVLDMFYMRLFAMLCSYILLAVPFFVFMGIMLEHAGIMEKVYDALYLCFGGARGGLAVSTVVIGTVIAACVGVIAASVTMLSVIALPSMVKRGYSKSLASGSVCAGGTLGILIPPSIMLVVYGPMSGLPVGSLFFAAILPGLLLAFLYCSYIALRCLFQPEIAPAVPPEERAIPFIKKTSKLVVALVPTAALILAVLGSIFFGIAAPTEAAAVGALAATLLTVVYRRFSFEALKEAALGTMRLSGMVLLIVALASGFVGVFIRAGSADVVANVILAAPGGRWGAFAVIMIMCFILGTFIDWMGIVFILVPIITPIGAALGFDPLWFGIMICINLQMSFLTPPFAYSIFFVRASAPPELGVATIDIIRGVIPFVIIVVVALGLCIAFPQIILWLPHMMF